MSRHLERRQPFAQSRLWQLQRDYFAGMGVDAWRRNQVPHYVTNNPTIARGYAALVVAFWRDHQRSVPSAAPFYICEVGAGSGRFAFHFLDCLRQLCERENIPVTAFRYLLTDFAPSNVAFWRRHPRFQRFYADGLIDYAVLDVTQPEAAPLAWRGTALHLEQPLVVIANYVFDSIPQELYYFHQQRCYPCAITLTLEGDPAPLSPAEMLARLRYQIDVQPTASRSDADALLSQYRARVDDGYVLVPAAGLRCVQHFFDLSPRGLLLLSADKGDHELAAVCFKQPPDLVRHGSFSLPVNYHAFKEFCEQRGGLALLPNAPPAHISVNGWLMAPGAAPYTETRRAYHHWLHGFSPDDLFTMMSHLRDLIPRMDVAALLAYARLSQYDSHQFAHMLPRLIELATTVDGRQRQPLQEVIERVWARYFPLGEALDLADQIATLWYALDEYERALTYFERSIEIYGHHTGTLFNMAACHHLLGRPARARELLTTVLRHDPTNEQARALLTR